jgi:hypothetical protein
VACARLCAEGRGGLVKAEAVVLDDLTGPSDRVEDGVAVARQGQPRCKLDRAAQGLEVVAEGVRARVGVEADCRVIPQRR